MRSSFMGFPTSVIAAPSAPLCLPVLVRIDMALQMNLYNKCTSTSPLPSRHRIPNKPNRGYLGFNLMSYCLCQKSPHLLGIDVCVNCLVIQSSLKTSKQCSSRKCLRTFSESGQERPIDCCPPKDAPILREHARIKECPISGDIHFSLPVRACRKKT